MYWLLRPVPMDRKKFRFIYSCQVSGTEFSALKKDFPSSTINSKENLNIIFDDFEGNKKLKEIHVLRNGDIPSEHFIAGDQKNMTLKNQTLSSILFITLV